MTYKNLDSIKPSAEMLALQVANDTMDRVILGYSNPRCVRALRNKLQVEVVAHQCGRGTQLVADHPMYKAALWLV